MTLIILASPCRMGEKKKDSANTECENVFFLSHLNGCSLEMVNRPSLLITDSFNATYVQPRRKQRDEQLLSMFLFISYMVS